MQTASATTAINTEFVSRLAERAQEAEQLRRLPAATVAEFVESGFTELLVPARYGGRQAEFPAMLDPVRRMARGCVPFGGYSTTPSVRSKPLLPQAIPYQGLCARRLEWPPRTSFTSHGR